MHHLVFQRWALAPDPPRSAGLRVRQGAQKHAGFPRLWLALAGPGCRGRARVRGTWRPQSPCASRGCAVEVWGDPAIGPFIVIPATAGELLAALGRCLAHA